MEEHDNSWCIADVGFVDVFKIWDDIVCVYIYIQYIYTYVWIMDMYPN